MVTRLNSLSPSWRKRTLLFTIPIILFSAQIISYANDTVVDEPVATVNGEAISRDELYKRLLQIGGRGILEQMIGDILIAQEAKSKGIKATTDETEEKMNEYKKRFSKVDNLEEMLKKNGMTIEGLRQNMELEILTRKLILRDVHIAENQIQRYYEENKDRLGEYDKLKIRMIQVNTEEEANRLIDELRRGTDFAELAREHSIAPSSKNGGDIGYITQGSGKIDFALESAVNNLATGEYTTIPVKTRWGYYILKLEDRIHGKGTYYEDVKEDIREILTDNEVQRGMLKLRQDLRAKAKVEINLP